VLRTSPFALFTTGGCAFVARGSGDRGWVDVRHLVADPCGERTFVLLVSKGNADGLSAFLKRIVTRLGGGIVDSELLHKYVADLLAKQTTTYQELLEALHCKADRNAAGIRQPGDDYGMQPTG